MKLLKTLPLILLTLLLTFLTQIGGLILIGCLPLFKLMDHKIQKRFKRRILKPLAFMGIYLLVSFTILPLLAKPFGRVPLPIFSNSLIKPLNIMTCVLNRHYVTPELLQTVKSVTKKMNTKHPGTIISYLDTNFPFINNFPLFPHLSHDDGEKLDLTFYYLDSQTQQPTNAVPSFIGYGVYEEPLPGEVNTPADCKNKGYWHCSTSFRNGTKTNLPLTQSEPEI